MITPTQRQLPHQHHLSTKYSAQTTVIIIDTPGSNIQWLSPSGTFVTVLLQFWCPLALNGVNMGQLYASLSKAGNMTILLDLMEGIY